MTIDELLELWEESWAERDRKAWEEEWNDSLERGTTGDKIINTCTGDICDDIRPAGK